MKSYRKKLFTGIILASLTGQVAAVDPLTCVIAGAICGGMLAHVSIKFSSTELGDKELSKLNNEFEANRTLINNKLHTAGFEPKYRPTYRGMWRSLGSRWDFQGNYGGSREFWHRGDVYPLASHGNELTYQIHQVKLNRAQGVSYGIAFGAFAGFLCAI